MTLHVSELNLVDFPAWRALFDDYNVFYGRPPTARVTETVWGWLHDPAHELEGAVARDGDTAVGIAHFRRVPSPGRGCDVGWLDDLFVAERGRGRGAGRALIEHVRGVGVERGWPVVRWTTADDNYRARGLYDTLGRKTPWNLYEMTAADVQET